ncbi:major facilitator superfamily domain-containing protein 6 isoform X1 [Procambarus clarkii]|uniref:major facilitator superfamily domain-containing protein 6 isoform X1 n=2 Tax=Procambarus clarkii TaxID=6728 RepID=UPI00374272EE
MTGSVEAGKGWSTWLKKELTWKKELILIKVIQFLYSGGTSSILPYLTLHMQELGLTVAEIATVYAFLPITSILGPPLSGLVADRFGRFKQVVVANMVLTVVLHCALLYVPARPRASIRMSCGPDGNVLTWSCNTCHQQLNNTQLQLTLQLCEFDCVSPPSELSVCVHEEDLATCHNYSLFDQITLNGTVLSWREEEKCNHTLYNPLYDQQVYHTLSCSSQCHVKCQVMQVPQCHVSDDPDSTANTFWIYFVLRMIATFFLNSLFTMMDAMTLAIVRQHNGDYGKQRFLFILGLATVPLLAGFTLDWHEASVGYKDYSPAFYLGAALCLVSAALITRLCFTVEPSGDKVVADLLKLVTRPEINVYLVMVLVMGSNWGFLESYLFLYLETLHAPSYLMGLTLTVGSLVGMPVMLIADAVVEKLRRPTIFIISFFIYAIRHIGYSYINDPWLVFPFEVLEVFTYQLMWVAAITYCSILAPKGLLATMTGLTGAIHFSLGRGLGSLVGGHLINNLGLPAAFRAYGGIAAGSGILYVLIHFCYIKKKLSAREEERQREAGECLPMMDNDAAHVLVNQVTAESSL